MPYDLLTITLAALIIALFRKDLRLRMIFAGLLTLPVLILKPIISTDFTHSIDFPNFIFYMLMRVVMAFSFGAVASAIYESLLHKHITPDKHPMRSRMLWLILGIAAFAVLVITGQNVITGLLIALLIDVLIILVIRKDLIWDMIFSGFAMGMLYLITFAFISPNFSGDITRLWFSDSISGITLFSVPVEEIIAITLLGSLIGPIYVAIKDIKEK